ncbi:hypothetical protein BgAZ_402520 [Babesia gibsoni]|uniref:Uncharacterized protein n=1 Tax=Babesia gibsoni TaxID=33632 RepID=A0AAD8LIJ2_BABGI|nr:hypothetical protein BgAZ_402520 [Babesia gibsoni]
MITCDNCGELIRYAGEGEITCEVCGVIQQRFSQAVIEEFSASYTQTQKVGRLKRTPKGDEVPTGEEAESRDFHFIVGIQLVLENLCKTVVNSFGISNQVEAEAKNIWARYLTFVVENDVPVSNMFSDPLTSGQKYYVDSSYMKNSFQVPMDCEKYNTPKRIKKVILDMGKTSFEYSTMLCVFRGDQEQYARNNEANATAENDTEDMAGGIHGSMNRNARSKKRRSMVYDYTDVNAYLEGSEVSSVFNGSIDAAVELPRSRRCSPTGFPLYILEEMLALRRIPSSPFLSSDCISLEASNPYRIAYMMGLLYRHDFLWRLLYAYPHLEPLECFQGFQRRFGYIPNQEIIQRILENPLELSDLYKIADEFGIAYDPGKYKRRRHYYRALRVELINKAYIHIVDIYFAGHKLGDMLSFNISWVSPRMDLQLVCAIIFLALLRCRYGVVINDIIRWIIQGRIPLRSSACLLPDSILRAAFRESKMAPRMKYASNPQEEVAYNLFTNTHAPNSCRHIEMVTSRLLLCGVFSDSDKQEKAAPLSYNVHGLCRRIVHHLRLPTNVLPIVDLIINILMGSKYEGDEQAMRNSTEYKHSLMVRMGVIYGTCLGGYPLHIFGAACVLVACRMLWPVLHYDAPAYPCRKEPYEADGNAGIEREIAVPSYDTNSESHIIKHDRVTHNITFDPKMMSWIVKVPVDLIKNVTEPAHSGAHHENMLKQEEYGFLSHIARMAYEPKAVAPEESLISIGRGKVRDDHLFQSLCETIQGRKDTETLSILEAPDDILKGTVLNEYRFDATSRGYSHAGISALLWLLHLQPSDAIKACCSYIIPYDELSLRYMALLHIINARSNPIVKSVAKRYTRYRQFNKTDQCIVEALKSPNVAHLWLNMVGQWSGSVLKCLGLSEEMFMSLVQGFIEMKTNKDAEDILPSGALSVGCCISVISELLDGEDVSKEVFDCSPSNKWLYYMLTSLFRSYPFYSGWSPEKALEMDCYRSLIHNQRNQVLESVKETLTTQLVGEDSNAWSHILRNLEETLTCKRRQEWPSWLAVLDDPCDFDMADNTMNDTDDNVSHAYACTREVMRNIFQELGSVTEVGRQLPPNPWRDYNSLRG